VFAGLIVRQRRADALEVPPALFPQILEEALETARMFRRNRGWTVRVQARLKH